jgi:hypothetical protein
MIFPDLLINQEITTPIHALELSRVRALREWHEGYDELEAIPNSFAVELQDDAPCLFFADSAEDKVCRDSHHIYVYHCLLTFATNYRKFY